MKNKRETELRAALQGKRADESLRRRVVEYSREAVLSGATVTSTAVRLGMKPNTLHRWHQQAGRVENAAVGFVERHLNQMSNVVALANSKYFSFRPEVRERAFSMRGREINAELGALWKLALPLALAQAGQALMGLVDTAMVGRLSPAAQAGAGLGSSLTFTCLYFGMGVMMALDPLVAQSIGAGERAQARTYYWQGVWLSLFGPWWWPMSPMPYSTGC